MDEELRRRMAPLSERRTTASFDSTMHRPVRTQPPRAHSVNNAAQDAPRHPAPSANVIPASRKRTTASRRIIKKRHLIIVMSVFIIVLIMFGAYLFIFGDKSVADKTGPALVTNLSQPNFTPLVPQGESQLASLNYSTAFNKAQDSYTFNDLYLGVPISVSEQPMPSNSSSSLTSNEVIESLVKKYNANITVSYRGGTAYLANVSATNKQLIIFNENDLLVFIQASMNIAPDAWVSYIDNLYQP